MPPRNVEIVHRFLELALARRDFDGAMRLTDPEVEFDWSNSRAPYSGVFRGRAELERAWHIWLEAWEEWRTEVAEAIEVDPETVLIVTHVHARGKGSGVTVEAGGAGVWQLRDGKIIGAKLFQSKADALAAVSPRPT